MRKAQYKIRPRSIRDPEAFEATRATDEIRSARQKVVALVSTGTGQARKPVTTTPQHPLLTVALSDQVALRGRFHAANAHKELPTYSICHGRRERTLKDLTLPASLARKSR